MKLISKCPSVSFFHLPPQQSAQLGAVHFANVIEIGGDTEVAPDGTMTMHDAELLNLSNSFDSDRHGGSIDESLGGVSDEGDAYSQDEDDDDEGNYSEGSSPGSSGDGDWSSEGFNDHIMPVDDHDDGNDNDDNGGAFVRGASRRPSSSSSSVRGGKEVARQGTATRIRSKRKGGSSGRVKSKNSSSAKTKGGGGSSGSGNGPLGKVERGNYACSKCGQPKRGHVCAFQPRQRRRNPHSNTARSSSAAGTGHATSSVGAVLPAAAAASSAASEARAGIGNAAMSSSSVVGAAPGTVRNPRHASKIPAAAATTAAVNSAASVHLDTATPAAAATVKAAVVVGPDGKCDMAVGADRPHASRRRGGGKGKASRGSGNHNIGKGNGRGGVVMPANTCCASAQAEMDSAKTVRELYLDAQGFPESYVGGLQADPSFDWVNAPTVQVRRPHPKSYTPPARRFPMVTCATGPDSSNNHNTSVLNGNSATTTMGALPSLLGGNGFSALRNYSLSAGNMAAAAAAAAALLGGNNALPTGANASTAAAGSTSLDPLALSLGANVSTAAAAAAGSTSLDPLSMLSGLGGGNIPAAGVTGCGTGGIGGGGPLTLQHLAILMSSYQHTLSQSGALLPLQTNAGFPPLPLPSVAALAPPPAPPPPAPAPVAPAVPAAAPPPLPALDPNLAPFLASLLAPLVAAAASPANSMATVAAAVPPSLQPPLPASLQPPLPVPAGRDESPPALQPLPAGN